LAGFTINMRFKDIYVTLARIKFAFTRWMAANLSWLLQEMQAEKPALILQLPVHPLARGQRRMYDKLRYCPGGANVSNARAETVAIIPRIGGPSVPR
jgi:hypothetical protein